MKKFILTDCIIDSKGNTYNRYIRMSGKTPVRTTRERAQEFTAVEADEVMSLVDSYFVGRHMCLAQAI